MKKSLVEQIERIHTLTYGKKVIKEGFLEDLLGNKPKDQKGLGNDQTLPDDLKDFYNTLQSAIDQGGLQQEAAGSMTYKKEVKTMQIGLMLLGFPLPQHGVDGLFGPETAAAVQQFKQKYGVLKETAEDIRSTLDSLGYQEKGSELSSGGQITDQLSTVVDNILKDFKTAKPDVKVTVTSGNDKYHQGLGYNSKHTLGQAVDLTLNPYNQDSASAFLQILNKYKGQDNKFSYIDEYTNPSGAATGGHFHLQYGEGVTSGGATMKNAVFASPEMLSKMGELLREKNITSDQLNQYIDKVTSGGGAQFTDLDITTSEGYQKYAEICQKFIDSRQPNLLNITGKMMAEGAKQAFERYQRFVPAELALSQLVLEGGVGNKDPNSRPIKTRNPFNVGNVDSGADVYNMDVQQGINAYYNLVAANYLGKGKTAADLMNAFVNHEGERYASGQDYEAQLNTLAMQAHKYAGATQTTTSQAAE
jgi:peptidoglycan hydrolase-like protein with peptidoglycan-binding domain